jgi:hypothetical protein
VPRQPEPISIEAILDWQTQMRQAFIQGVTGNDMKGIMEALVKRAKEGDMTAIRLILTYAVGSPRSDAVADVTDEPRPPDRPIKALPKTPAKLDALAMRARNGESLFHSKDARYGED